MDLRRGGAQNKRFGTGARTERVVLVVLRRGGAQNERYGTRGACRTIGSAQAVCFLFRNSRGRSSGKNGLKPRAFTAQL